MPKECCKKTWEKIPEDEPVFILRGQDLISGILVEEWIQLAERWKVNKDKIDRAKEHLQDIRIFQLENPRRCKTPD